MITLTVNGTSQHLDVEPDTPLREPARDNLGIPAVAYCSPMAMPEGPLPAWFWRGYGAFGLLGWGLVGVIGGARATSGGQSIR